MILRLDCDVPSSVSLAGEFEGGKLLARLQALDSMARIHGLSKLDPTLNELIRVGMEIAPGGTVTKNGYGVFQLAWLAAKHPECPGLVREELDSIKAAIKAQHGVPIKYVIWAGVGGAVEDKAMYLACGLLKRGPKQYILDSVDPAKLKAILAEMKRRSGSLEAALQSTLVVGVSMDVTSYEPAFNFEKIAALYEEFEIESGPNFLYLGLKGSTLGQFASKRGYRRMEPQFDGGDTTIGWHSSPLTRCSLYALGLAGVALVDWIGAACLSDEYVQYAFRLAAFLHQQGLAGRDKVTLVLAPSLQGAALWTKQNFEASLGKSEQLGIKIVACEPLRMADYRAPKDPRQDRVFLLVARQAEPAVDRVKAGVLRRSGYPLASLTLSAGIPLSEYLQFIHYLVFALGWLREMNLVTQPGVDLCKAITNTLYQNSVFQGSMANTAEWKALRDSPRQLRWRSSVVLNFNHLPCGFQLEGRDAASAYAALVHQLSTAGIVEYGHLTFFGDTRYNPPGKQVRRILDRAASQLFRGALKIPVDVSESPSMCHACHEMVAGHGRCLSTVLISEKPESIPNIGYNADYNRAQFLAVQMALEQSGRLVVAITLRDLSEPSLQALDEFFRQAAAQIRRSR